MGDRLQGQLLASKADDAEAVWHQLERVAKGEPADAGLLLQVCLRASER